MPTLDARVHEAVVGRRSRRDVTRQRRGKSGKRKGADADLHLHRQKPRRPNAHSRSHEEVIADVCVCVSVCLASFYVSVWLCFVFQRVCLCVSLFVSFCVSVSVCVYLSVFICLFFPVSGISFHSNPYSFSQVPRFAADGHPNAESLAHDSCS